MEETNFPKSIETSSQKETPSNVTSSNNSINNNTAFPTLIDVLRRSGGITIYADLSNIKVTRLNSISDGGSRIQTSLNLYETLDLKDDSQNIRILDGDRIFVNKNNEIIFENISKVIKGNINPKFITVFLAGRVENSGAIRVSNSSTLNEAVSIGGGARALKGKVRFLRYNNDGTILKKKISALYEKGFRGLRTLALLLRLRRALSRSDRLARTHLKKKSQYFARSWSVVGARTSTLRLDLGSLGHSQARYCSLRRALSRSERLACTHFRFSCAL